MGFWTVLLTGIGSVGSGLGYAASNDPIVFLTVPAGIVLIGAAVGVGTGLAVGLAEGFRYLARATLGVPNAEGLPVSPRSRRS